MKKRIEKYINIYKITNTEKIEYVSGVFQFDSRNSAINAALYSDEEDKPYIDCVYIKTVMEKK